MSQVKIVVTPYDKVSFQPVKTLLSSEVNEIQDIRKLEDIRTRQFASGDGPNGESFRVGIIDDENLKIGRGFFVHLGETLYLDEDVTLPYDINLIDQGEQYRVVCRWRDVPIDSSQDSSILDTRVGPTSERVAKELTFCLERADTLYRVEENLVLLADANFTGSVTSPNPLTSNDLVDRRYDHSQHYVSGGLNIDDYDIVGTEARITLTSGSLFYLQEFVQVQDVADLRFFVPLPSGTTGVSESRVLLYYTIEETAPDQFTAIPNYVAMTDEATLNEIPLRLYEVTITASGVVPESINDVRAFEPVLRKVTASRGAQATLADFYALKPRPQTVPSLRVTINQGWYYLKGEYYYLSEQFQVHDPVFTGGNVRRDSVVLTPDNVLTLYQGDEILAVPNPPESTSIPEGSLRIYDVIIADTTTQIVYPDDPANLNPGEIQDRRPIITALDASTEVSVDNTSFSGIGSGGLSNTTEKSLQGYLEEIDSKFVSVDSDVASLGIVPQDSAPDIVNFDGTSKSLEIGHDPYTGINNDNTTKVGISVIKDPLNSNRVLIQNTWDEDMRLITSPVVLDSSYHTHAGIGDLEKGAEINFRETLMDFSDQNFTRASEFVLTDASASKFIRIAAAGSVPAHFALRLDPSGGLEFGVDGYKVDSSAFEAEFDTERAIKTDANGAGVYINAITSGLEFIDDGTLTNHSYLALKIADEFTIVGGALTLNLSSTGGLLVDGANELRANTDWPIHVNGTNQIALRYQDVAPTPTNESYLEARADSGTPTEFYLGLKVAPLRGLGAFNDGSKNLLSMLIEAPFSFSGSGGLQLDLNSTYFNINGSDQLDFDPSGLADGQSITENLGTLSVNIDTNYSLTIDPVDGLRVVVNATGGLEDTGSGLQANLESTNPSLEIKGGGELGARIDTDGGLEVNADGIRIAGYADSNSVASGYVAGGSYFTSGPNENLNPSVAVYSYNDKSFSYLADPADPGYIYGVLFGIDTKAYQMGGEDVSNTAQSSNNEYDFGTDTWSASTVLADPVTRAIGVGLDTFFGCLFGGEFDLGNDPVLTFDGSTFNTAATDLTAINGDISATRASMAGELSDTDIVCFGGGIESAVYQNEVFTIEFAANKLSVVGVTTLATTLTSSAGFSTAFSLATDFMNFAGGKDGTVTYYRSHDKVDISTPTTTVAMPIPVTGIADLSSAVINGEGVMFAGTTIDGDALGDVLIYNETDDTWRTETKMLVALKGTSAFSR